MMLLPPCAPHAAVSESKLAAMSIFSKGLVTTLLGLIGVFLVLTLFYVAIKLLQRERRKPRRRKGVKTMLYSQSDREAAAAAREKAQRGGVDSRGSAAAAGRGGVSCGTGSATTKAAGSYRALLTILGGAYAIFFYGVYLRPMRKYKKHLDYMLDGQKRVSEGILKADQRRTVIDRDGIDCYTVEINVGEKDDPEDDRVFYLDALQIHGRVSAGRPDPCGEQRPLIAAVTKL